MTKHLYYEDSYLIEFSARVVDALHVNNKPAVILDQSAFYPASGGQPCDTGSLNGVRVDTVEEDGSGRIIHILEAAVAGAEVTGKIDWERRFDHMQQHTGQHILSQAFLRVAEAPTLSFHLGQESCTIDLDLQRPDPAVLTAAEDLAARLVFADRPVHILSVEREDLKALGVRKDSQREGKIRVIDIENFDRSPCGGTHVRRSGEIGLIAILGSERYKGGTRVEFVCGNRVLACFRKDHGVLRELGRLTSAHPHELPGLTEKLLSERASLLREKKHFEDRVLEMEAQELRSRADKIDGVVAVCHSYPDRKIENLKALAQKLTTTPGTLAILGLTQETVQLIVARSADVRGDCGAAIKQLTVKLGGRGGGKPELAQAGGIAATALQDCFQAITEYFRTGWHAHNGLQHERDKTAG